MKTLTFGPTRLAKLYDELAVLPQLQPVAGPLGPEAVFSVSGDETVTFVQVPDDADEAAISAVVAAHDPTTPGPGEVLQQTRTSTDKTLRDRLVLRLSDLQAARNAITANPPTIFTSLPNSDRVVLRSLINTDIALIRLTLQMLDSPD